MTKPRTYKTSLMERTLNGVKDPNPKHRALAKRLNAFPAEVVEQSSEVPAPPQTFDIEKTLGQLVGMPVTMPTSNVGIIAWCQSIGQRIKMNGYIAIADKWVKQTDNVVRIMQNTVNTQQMYLELQDLFTELQFDVEIKRLNKSTELMQAKTRHAAALKAYKAGLPPLPEIVEPGYLRSPEDIPAGTTEDDTE